jgi:hypothetical protein
VAGSRSPAVASTPKSLDTIEPAARRPLAPVDLVLTGVGATRRWLLRLIVGATAAAAFLIYALLRNGFPDGVTASFTIIGILAALAPPVILFTFWLALGELAGLPARLQRLPLDARGHGEELRAIVDRARSARGSRFQLARVLWQLIHTSAAARETLTPYGPLLPFLSVPFLVSTGIAVLAAGFELIVAGVVALVLLTG